MKELMELLTRVVVAFEKIADNKTDGCDDCTCEEQKPIKDIPRDLTAIAAQSDGRDVLLDMCKKKGIIIPSGTRTNTLVKMLKKHETSKGLHLYDYDQIETTLRDEETEETEEVEEEKLEDHVEEIQKEVDNDPDDWGDEWVEE